MDERGEQLQVVLIVEAGAAGQHLAERLARSAGGIASTIGSICRSSSTPDSAYQSVTNAAFNAIATGPRTSATSSS